MPEATVEAAPQPAPPAQPSGDVKQGAQNVSASDYARLFMKPAQPVDTPKAETPAEPQPEKTEETPVAPVETPDTEESKVEAEAQAEVEAAEPEESETDVLSKSTSLTPEQQAIIDKRIGKAVAKQRKAERDAAELKLQIAELQSKAEAQPAPAQDSPSLVPLPIGAPPLANINTIEGLQKLQSEAKQAVRFAEISLRKISDGGAAPEGFTKDLLYEVLDNARTTLEDSIPARAQFLQTRHQVQQKASELFPFLNDRNSSDYKIAQGVWERHPYLRNTPDGDAAVGLIVEGLKAVESRNKVQAKPAPVVNKPVISKPKPASDQTAVSATGSERVPVSTASDRALGAELAKLSLRGGVSASEYALSLSKQSQLRNSR